MTIADKILIYRAKNRLSQKAFAALVGTYPSYISDIETGKRQPGKIMKTRIELVLNDEVLKRGLKNDKRNKTADSEGVC